MQKPYRILSLDGGGIRGVIPALVLAELERLAGRPVSQMFDLIAGTSTGGILALGLAKPAPDGGPAYRALDMASLYQSEGATIFSKPWPRRLLSLWGLAEEKYAANGIEGVLARYFGEARLKDALTDVLVTGYEMERRQPFFFRSSRARCNSIYDFPMAAAARATSAAPTFFEPAKVGTSTGAGYFALVDGGVFANNPAMCAYVDAVAEGHRPEDIRLVSIGTGQTGDRLCYQDACKWGAAQWARPFINIALDSVSAAVDYQLRHVLRHDAGQPKRYWRFQTTLAPANEGMDNACPQNLRELRLLAEDLVRNRRDEFCELLDSV